MSRLIVSLCTNDLRGNDTGRVSAVHVADALELQWGEIGSEPKYAIEDGWLKLSRRIFLIHRSTQWYGNWCWTGVSMSDFDAANLLNYLSTEDRWHCEGGRCSLSDAYVEGKVTEELMKEVRESR